MSETKTVRIVFDGPPSHESGRFVEVEDDEGASISIGEWVERPDGCWELQLPIIPGANAVVTPEGLEAAAKAIRERARVFLGVENDSEWDELHASIRSTWCAVARDAFEDAGIVVANEVMTQVVDMVDGDNGSIRWLNSTDADEEWSFTELNPGDKLYIVRKKKV